MCIFCAAIPVAAATGAKLNGKQLREQRQAESAGTDKPELKPILPLTVGAVSMLVIGSIAYHTLTHLPY